MSLVNEYRDWYPEHYGWDGKYHDAQCEEKPMDSAKCILFKVMANILHRKGFDDVFATCNWGIQDEIFETSLEIIREYLPKK